MLRRLHEVMQARTDDLVEAMVEDYGDVRQFHEIIVLTHCHPPQARFRARFGLHDDHQAERVQRTADTGVRRDCDAYAIEAFPEPRAISEVVTTTA